MFSELLPVSESINQLVLFSGNAIPKPLLPRPCFLILVYFIQYNNTIQLSFDIALPLTGSSKVHLDASAAQMQLVGLLQGNNCVRRTCSRSLHSDCLGRGQNRYSSRYRCSNR